MRRRLKKAFCINNREWSKENFGWKIVQKYLEVNQKQIEMFPSIFVWKKPPKRGRDPRWRFAWSSAAVLLWPEKNWWRHLQNQQFEVHQSRIESSFQGNKGNRHCDWCEIPQSQWNVWWSEGRSEKTRQRSDCVKKANFFARYENNLQLFHLQPSDETRSKDAPGICQLQYSVLLLQKRPWKPVHNDQRSLQDPDWQWNQPEICDPKHWQTGQESQSWWPKRHKWGKNVWDER